MTCPCPTHYGINPRICRTERGERVLVGDCKACGARDVVHGGALAESDTSASRLRGVERYPEPRARFNQSAPESLGAA